MAANGTMETTPGSERTPAERLAVQWPNLPRNLFPEGEDCYGDPDRAAYVRASYAGITEAVEHAAPGEAVMLLGRRHERAPDGEFKRLIALGELAGSGAGMMLDFREGRIVLPTSRYALLVRDGLSAITKHRGPEVHGGPLDSGRILKCDGLLPPKEELMDRPLYTTVPSNGRTPSLRSVDKEEIWNRSGEIAIGDEAVEELIDRTLRTNGRRTRRIYGHDFAVLQGTLTEEAATG